MKNIANELIKTLQSKHLTLALAESVTCGLAAHKLSGVKGTSDVLTGSVVCYKPEVKCGLLSVSKKRIEKYTCESMEVTTDLIKGLQKLIDADIYAAITGLASTGGSETSEKPVGTVFMAIKIKTSVYTQQKIFSGSPRQIKTLAARGLYDFILSKIK